MKKNSVKKVVSSILLAAMTMSNVFKCICNTRNNI